MSIISTIAYGVGTAHLSAFRQVFGLPEFDSVQLIVEALNMDTATLTLPNKDAEVASALKQTKLSRQDLFITSKALCTNGLTVDEALSQQLSRLGLDYFDLYLIHNPRCAKNDGELQDKWKEMEAAYRSGRARSIGVSNFTKAQLQPIPEVATIRPSVNQFEYHAYAQHEDLVSWMKNQGMVASCYSSLAPIMRGNPGPVDGKLGQSAKKYGVEESDIAVKRCWDQGLAVATTGKNLHRLKGYLDDFDKFRRGY
ncbi:aldose reductase [Metarhizium acridum CQMa 102]|uniref:Aldose reductase n=1 Tax=Metarhizium acridum (strain CQMa 102) TaxID=655827 RepID=E9DXC7_METAQ|nr:aldose reductase [Metarhizium acridum CQMa 102]EFY91685.1 aldose reductase [Metarhizium acridum CQMa 102]